MATRDRTALFVQYRNSFGRSHSKTAHAGLMSLETDRVGLLGDGSVSSSALPSQHAIEMSRLPPRCPYPTVNGVIAYRAILILESDSSPCRLDIVEEIEEDMEQIKQKMQQVESMHKKHILPGFDDSRRAEESIESMAQEITNKLKRVEQDVVKSTSASPQEKLLGKNVQISMATKLQELSTKFRKSQSTYLQKLRGREIKGGANDILAGIDYSEEQTMNMGFTEQQLEVVFNNDRQIEERSQEIMDIAKSIHQLAEIFRDLQTMIIDQGTILDRIDYNIEQVATSMKSAHTELEVGEKYQKKAQGKLCFILLGCLILILLLVLIFKPRRR